MKRIVLTACVCIIIACMMSIIVCAEQNPTVYYLTDKYTSTFKSDVDKGFSGEEKIDGDDVHFGWSLGQFTLTGFTDVEDENGIPVFIVNPGDSITLSYSLFQDINKLNGRDDLYITDNHKGYDERFQIARTDTPFGRGTLIVKHVSYNKKTTVTPYYNYLEAVQNQTGTYAITNLEEGDYEVALDYEITDKGTIVFITTASHTDYQTRCSFKIRNANCMAYITSTDGKDEYANCSVAENGFKVIYTSFHQHVTVTREILTDNGFGYSLTPRLCTRAYDGVVYLDDGIYTISVTNDYPGASEQIWKIAVGTDAITNAYITGNCVYDPGQIAEMVESGMAQITDDWRLEKVTPLDRSNNENEPVNITVTTANSANSSFPAVYIYIICAIAAVSAAVGVLYFIKSKKKKLR